jgi:hypothetical protein
MKTKNLFRLVKWFCRKLTFDELASVVLILHEVLSGFRRDIELKPDQSPPHFREFKVDTIPPLEFPSPVQRLDWRELQEQNPVSTVRRRKNSVCHLKAAPVNTAEPRPVIFMSTTVKNDPRYDVKSVRDFLPSTEFVLRARPVIGVRIAGQLSTSGKSTVILPLSNAPVTSVRITWKT